MATARQLQRYQHRGTTTQRGLGAAHQKLRAQLLPAALGTHCPGPWTGPRSTKCTGLMTNPAHMDLDDRVPRAYGGRSTINGARMCCRSCNRGHGGRLSQQIRTAKRKPLPTW